MHHRIVAAGISAVLILAGCAGAAPAGSAPAASAPVGGASAAAPAGSNPPAVVPGTTQGPAQAFAGDSTLAGRFPKQVAGQPVSTPKTYMYFDFFMATMMSPTEIDAATKKFANAGIDVKTLIYGLAEATVDGESLNIYALRLPGKSADLMIKNLATIDPLEPGYKLAQETSGGKQVSVVRDDRGDAADWYYGTGDTVWFLSTDNEAEAAAVFKALQ